MVFPRSAVLRAANRNSPNPLPPSPPRSNLPRMLLALRVKNLAIVENVRVDFSRGLNVVTGETGAGKSIVVGALGLVLGDRADKSMIRAGEDRCGVEATFQLADPAGIDEILEELGMDPCEDGCLIVRRIIAASGPGKILVNDCPSTLQVLKRIGDLLIDMHGPHDHQSLLSEDFQVDLLDSFGHLWDTRAKYEAVYSEVLDLERSRRELECDDQEVAQQVDMLSFQVQEIESADLTDGDEESLETEHATTANAQRILQLSEGIREALTEGEGAAFDALAAAQGAISELAAIMSDAEAWAEEARSIAVQIQELSDTLNRSVQGVEDDPGRLQWLEDRMALIHKLKRKYGATVPEILQFHENARDRLTELESRTERIKAIDASLLETRKKLASAGKKLTKERGVAAAALGEAITAQLRDLGFPHGAFDVGMESAEPRPTGMDGVEFGFAPNVGEPMRPLRAIASSGEISRVMLASKAVLADHDRIPVLIFDEIDANVGGEMGNAIGSKLAAVARNHQVLCITHLPQVAVHGKTHFVVAKRVQDGRTYASIEVVEDAERAEEVARMLGGKDLTSVTLRHAREMLESV